MPLLEVIDLEKTFTLENRSIPALDHLSLSIEEYEFVSIVGPSGCGKSTFLHIVGGFEEADGGQISLAGEHIAKPGPHRGMMFQYLSLFPWLTVMENVRWPLEMKRLPKDECIRRAQSILELVDLGRFAHAFPAQLSGGMRQRVALARLLALDSKILLMDEPFRALGAPTPEPLQAELRTV